MLSVTIAQLKSDIAGKMRGTSIREVKDFYGTVSAAANRMLARIDPQETIRVVTMSTPFYDNIQDYALVTDYKRMIDIRPQANRRTQPGISHFNETTPRQFLENLDPNSFSIKYNNGIRSIRAQKLPSNGITMIDSFDSATANGSWSAFTDASNLQTEILNYVEGNGSLSMNLSGATGVGYIENSTAGVVDLTALNNEDSSFLFFWIPVGYAARFTSFELRRGETSSDYLKQTATTKSDGTAFNDGWNMLRFDWVGSTKVGSPTNKLNTYRRFTINYSIGGAIPNCLIDNWSDSLGNLYEIEYYSECIFRSAAGAWLYAPTQDTDLLNVGPNSYEILKTEMMVDITQQIRQGTVQADDLANLRLMLNGQPQTRYVKDPPYHGLYADYLKQFPSSAIITATKFYNFDV